MSDPISDPVRLQNYGRCALCDGVATHLLTIDGTLQQPSCEICSNYIQTYSDAGPERLRLAVVSRAGYAMGRLQLAGLPTDRIYTDH